jgi:uncharacterized protein (TIGR00255 family)
MTGFGAAEVDRDGLNVRVELRSVNNRHLKLATRLPGLLEAQAPRLEGLVRARLDRGSVTLAVHLRRTREGAPARIVEPVLVDYAEQLTRIADATGLPRPSGIDALLRLPGALEECAARALDDAEVAIVDEALETALVGLMEMRDREGASLAAELEDQLRALERWAARVEERVPELVTAYRDRLRERLALLLDRPDPVPEELLAREVALLADKTDVEEELARLRTHVAAWRASLASGGPIGRRLDFISQEMGRETNTIGSKVANADVAQYVVELKLCVERLKEQAANVE